MVGEVLRMNRGGWSAAPATVGAAAGLLRAAGGRLRNRSGRVPAPRPLPLHFIWSRAALWTDEPDAILHWLGLDMSEVRSRPGGTDRRPAERYHESDARYPDFYAVGGRSAELLGKLARAARATVILETGVADGASTEALLSALDSSGPGMLHSVDISPDVGARVTDRRNWRLHVTDGTPTALAAVADGLHHLDMFLHDSGHGLDHQMAEYRIAWRNLRPGGLLCSDDIDWSPAFSDFCRRAGVPFAVLAEVMPFPKFFGVARRPIPERAASP